MKKFYCHIEGVEKFTRGAWVEGRHLRSAAINYISLVCRSFDLPRDLKIAVYPSMFESPTAISFKEGL